MQMDASSIVVSPMLKIPLSELQFRTSRSGGPGGQNVNKLETRVELLFDLLNSPGIAVHLKHRLQNNLISHVDSSGLIRIVVQQSRSQWQNKQLAVEKLILLLRQALTVRKKRIATKPTRTAKEVRLRTKKGRGEIKRLRKIVME
jgi:ribosome-associated protein